MNPFKNNTKKKFGGLILIFVIIVAFGFGGFGGGFNTGNQNNIAKINNTNIYSRFHGLPQSIWLKSASDKREY